MTKPSDLFKKTGTGGSSGAKMNPFAPIPGMMPLNDLSVGTPTGKDADKAATDKLMDNLTDDGLGITKKRDLGHGGPFGGKAKGGGGGSSARPKV